ncbi:MAG: hypothetical protein PHX72_02070 [Candidatus Shapirobacteria bacterium]|nr:hypothetical protein [Candidatus Shapirobacteria bacterium]
MAEFSFFLPLPKKTQLLVKEGDSLDAGQKVATFKRLKKQQINLAKELKINSDRVGQSLLVGLGQKINKGDPIAKATNFFKKTSFISPVTGQIFAFDKDTGLLTIEVAEKNRDLLTPFAGKVEKIDQEGLTIKITVEKVFNFDKCQGKDAFGRLFYHSGSLTSFDCQYQKQIILTNQISPALINKAQVIDSLAMVSDDKINYPNADITLVEVYTSQIKTLKNFINHPIIIDCQQKKIAVLKK